MILVVNPAIHSLAQAHAKQSSGNDADSNPDLGVKANSWTCSMSKPVVEVQVRTVAAASSGCAVFLGNEEKVFVMYVDHSVGAAITMFMQGTKRSDPSPMDLSTRWA